MNKLNTNTQLIQTDVKSSFFGQYFEQIVAKETKFPNSPTINTTTVFLINALSNYHLELKPLSKITNEDALKCWENDNYNASEDDIKEVSRLFLEMTAVNSDYLRSKGYAIPFMKHSVDDLISFGWVQLL